MSRKTSVSLKKMLDNIISLIYLPIRLTSEKTGKVLREKDGVVLWQIV